MQRAESKSELTGKLIGGLYTEAMLLADEARAYFDELGHPARDGLMPLERVSFSCESLKVTTRLMHIIAWLMARRGAASGRDTHVMPLAAAAPSDLASVRRLPADAVEIIEASIDLYQRVQRLEGQIEGEVAIPMISPALALRQRLERAF